MIRIGKGDQYVSYLHNYKMKFQVHVFEIEVLSNL